MEMTDLEVEFSVQIFESCVALLSELGNPADIDINPRPNREFHWGKPHGRSERPMDASTLFVGGLFGLEFIPTARELISKRLVDQDYIPASGYIAPIGLDIVPIYRQSDSHVEGFVIARVGDLAGSRIYPVVVPRDVIDFSITLLGSQTDRIRFLRELACIYRDAVRLSGESVCFGRELLTSLRNIVGALGIALGVKADYKTRDSGHAADDSEDRSDIHVEQHKQ